jgi:hypothetical protein
MDRRTVRASMLTIAAVLFPSIASADVGTPLMFAELGHLLIGNLLIGIGEGIVIAALFRIPRRPAASTMVAANYFSAFVGGIGLVILSNLTISATIYSGRQVLIAVLAASFVLTVLLEWPFIWKLLTGTPRRLRKSLLASLIAQTASYAVLVPWYLLGGSVSVYTQATPVRSLAFVTNPGACVYYISVDGRSLMRCLLDGSEKRIVKPITQALPNDHLFAAKSASGDKWDLYLKSGPGYENQETLLPNFAGCGQVPDRGESRWQYWPSWTGPAFDLRPDDERDWTFGVYLHPEEGLHARSASAGGEFWLAFGTPFMAWPTRCATVLPGDEVVYQLGEQIIVFDAPTRKIALVAEGRGPLVVPEGTPDDPPQTRKP